MDANGGTVVTTVPCGGFCESSQSRIFEAYVASLARGVGLPALLSWNRPPISGGFSLRERVLPGRSTNKG
jgi:hypothetical protein